MITNYQYQIDYSGGYENVHPDGYGTHRDGCSDETCEGCWDPSRDGFDAWFDAIKDEGAALKARVLFGSQELEERIFE